MEFTLWDVLTDLGLLSLLLLVGMVLRARVIFLQRSFMPASIIAGILGLILGPNGFQIIPFSDFIGTYPSESQIKQLVGTAIEWNGKVDVLINNAAVQMLGSLDELKLDDWNHTMTVNLTGPLLLSQHFLETLDGLVLRYFI